MKLLQIVFYGDPNGYPPIVNCVRSLAESGWETEIICRNERTHADVHLPAGISIHRVRGVPRHRWLDFFSFVTHAVRLRKKGAVIAGHDMHGLVPAAIMSWLAGAPLIYHCHDFTEASRRLPLGSRIVKSLESLCARRASLTVVPDERRGQVVQTQLGLRAPLIVIPNAPRIRASPPQGVLGPMLRARGHEFERIVLRQGRVGPGHGIEATVESMPLWGDASWGFVVIGPAEPGYAERLTLRAASLGVQDRFVILPPVSYDETPGITIEASLGHALYDPINVNHTEMGTASNKVLEYMAAGIPCLVSDSPSLRALIARYSCGVAADPSDVAAIADAIKGVLSDEAGAREMGRAGLRAFEGDLAYDHHFPKLMKWLGALH